MNGLVYRLTCRGKRLEIDLAIDAAGKIESSALTVWVKN